MFFGIIFPKDRILQYFCLCEFNSVNFLHVNKTICTGASGSKDGVALLLTIIWGTFAIHTNSSINYLVTEQDWRKKCCTRCSIQNLLTSVWSFTSYRGKLCPSMISFYFFHSKNPDQVH